MDSSEKREVESVCWKTILYAVVLLLIGVVIGHFITVKSCWMMGQCGGYGMKSCWSGGGMGGVCCWGHRHGGWKQVCKERKSWKGCKEGMSKCKPGCTCPKCSKKKSYLADPNKASCPLTGKVMDEVKEQ